MLVLRDLTKLYQSDGQAIRALDGVSLSVEGGQCVAVCGPSGCGKTTLLLVAGGLLGPDSGQLCEGVVFTTDPSRARAFATVLLVGESLEACRGYFSGCPGNVGGWMEHC